MNIIDIIVLGLLALFLMNGIYRGFLPSVMNLAGTFISWIIAFLGYPLVSRKFIGMKLFDSMHFYIEGAEKVGNVELARQPITAFTEVELENLVGNAKLASPYNVSVLENLKNHAFEAEGLTTVGEYFDATIYYTIVNILAFAVLFICVYVILMVITNAAGFSFDLPELRHFDRPLGGAIAVVRGFFFMYVLFLIIPIALILLPELITKFINSSFMSSIFYDGSIILRFISAVVG